jgi:hypothetical protein
MSTDIDVIEVKLNTYITLTFEDYIQKRGDGYSTLRSDDEYREWFHEFIRKISSDYITGYDITKHYDPLEVFGSNIILYGEIIEYINSFMINLYGDTYTLKYYDPVNVLRSLLYIYTCDKEDELYEIYKPTSYL